MNVYKGRLPKQLEIEIEAGPIKVPTTWLSNIAFHLLPIWLQTLVENFGCNQFRITPDIVSKLLRAAI